MTDEQRPSAPPGWYPLPGGKQRYWDGTAWTEEPPKPAPVAGTTASTTKQVGGGGCALLIVVVVVLWAIGSQIGSDEDDGGGEYGARDVCEQFIEQRLKSPSSADFSGEDAVDNADGTWTVRGDVDADNSFGASIRNRYVCTVRHTAGDNWTLVDLQLTAN